MPLITSSRELPEWAELEYYSISKLTKGSLHTFNKRAEREILFVCKGKCRLYMELNEIELSAGNVFELLVYECFKIFAEEDCMIAITGGHWAEETGTCGVFEIDTSDSPRNDGDKTDYARNTIFDNHYHDCDEYWIILEGKGIAVSEGERYSINTACCVLTKAGDHHDLPIVKEKITGVWLETTMTGKKRQGHLWNHTHDSAEIL